MGRLRIVPQKYTSVSAVLFVFALTCIFAMTLFSAPCLAQLPKDPFGGIPRNPGSSDRIPLTKDPVPADIAPTLGTGPESGEVYQLTTAEACNSWTETGVHSPSVSVARLRVPGKAASEYQKACGALKNRRLPSAEAHARKALEIYPDYAAAWVLLGQILQAEHKKDDARGACLQAQRVDSGYVAPYLCLAEFAAQEKDWPEMERLAERAIAVDPVNNFYALYYSASAAFHGERPAEAETKALDAVKLDKWNQLPQLHMLLARVYAARGDSRSEAAQLRQYLKLAPTAEDAAEARTTLAKLEAAPPK